MKIIAIVVTYNGMKWYKKCFDSLKYSSIPVETIVVDNKSTDDTISFIKSNYPDISLIESEKNLGFGKANNIGLKLALERQADFIFLLNQDAWVCIDTIEKLVNKMIENPKYGVLSPIHFSGEQTKLDKNFFNYLSNPLNNQLFSDIILEGKAKDKIYEVYFVNAALWLLSSKCLQTVGGFNPVFPHYGEDNDYINRMNIHGFKIGVYPYTTGIHDRPQIEGYRTFKQRYNRSYVSQLISLTNLSAKFSKLLYNTMFSLTISVISSILRLQIKELYLYTLTTFKVIWNMPVIINNRKKSRISGPTFLS